jgi:hypothetical protein
VSGAAKVIAPIIIAPVAWMVAASAIYCAGVGKIDLFAFPYTQWLQAAPWWRYSWSVGLWVYISAALPTLVLLICTAGAVRYYRRPSRRPLYGDSQWASDAEMRAGGIKQIRSG